MQLTRLAPVVLMSLLSACALAPLGEHKPLEPQALAQADAAMHKFIDAEQMPGGVLWIERAGVSHHRAFGVRAAGGKEVVTEDTVFDAASLTKATITATLVQRLRERGLLDMDAALSTYLPGCGSADFARITLRQLLTHSSGLPPDLRASDPFMSGPDPISVLLPESERRARIEAALERACVQPLEAVPGTHFRYSDLNFVLLGEILARVSGKPLQELARTEIFEPLGMQHSSYLPLQSGVNRSDIAPTGLAGETLLRGEVHDPTARRMGGVAGHAGLFTTAADLARLARMLLNDGVSDEGRRYLSHESIVLLETAQSPPGVTDLRSLGWDIATPFSRPRGSLYPVGKSFGHTGFTGCSFWLDPGSRSFYILLANRVNEPHPTNTLPLYADLGTLAALAAGLKPGSE